MIISAKAARAALVVLAIVLTSCVSAPQIEPRGPVELRVLAINDFHGNLDPPAGGARMPDPSGAVARVPAGGAPRLASLVAQRRAMSPNAIMVAAGDLIGASPMLSSLFHDEPTIEAMNLMGLAVSAVGNHEFDEGPDELRRMQTGGCHPRDGCRGPAPFTGAQFQYLAASTIVNATGQTLFPASAVRTFDGVKVGFIGLTLEGTPDLVTPSAAEGLTFRDEAASINAEVARLRGEGISAFVVLIHEGGFRGEGAGDCPNVSGPIIGIVEALDPAVDLVVSGHTNGIYICRVGGKLLTSAGSYGMLLTDIVLKLDRTTGDVTSAKAQNIIVAADALEPDPAQTAHIEAYRALAAPMMNRHVGELAQPLPNSASPSGESPMGRVIADSMILGAEAAIGERPEIALMNPGGVRAGLPHAGPVTLADLFTVQPFGNDLVVLPMTGAEIEAVLAQQFRAGGHNMILQVSHGAGFAWRRETNALVPGSVRIGGAPLDPGRTYRVVTNGFLAAGGDGFTAFRNDRPRTIAGADLDALAAYVGANTPLRAPQTARVRVE